MRRLTVAALAAMSLGLLLAATALAAGPMQKVRSDNLGGPLQDQQAQLLQKGINMKLAGKIAPDATVANVGKGHQAKYVKLAQTGKSDIFVLLAQFGGAPGPLANQIPKPDRTVDNETIWFDGGYSPMHYSQLYFDQTPGANSVANYYEGQSSGRFTFDGKVTDWVTVNRPEKYYGRNSCGGGDCSLIPASAGGGGLWQLNIDATNQWVVDQLAAGKDMAAIKSYLSQFDKEDRYDIDGDGNFDEPDGYIDHFQLIHAGEGEETGGGAQGGDAIWSHRWYNYIGLGTTGPGGLGGVQIGAASGHPTGFWVGDYIMENENAGVGVIAHETGHDFGVPDEYDQTYTGNSPSAWWTVMAQGSYGADFTNGIGNRPVDFDAYDKLLLGFLNYQVVNPWSAGKSGVDVTMGPSEYNTKNAQGAFVLLPQRAVATQVGPPTEGSHAGFSGTGNFWDSTATRSLTIPAGSSTLSFDAWYDTEQDWDYTFLEVSDDNGATWKDIKNSLSDPASAYANQSGFDADGTGISGTSGLGYLPDGAWYDNTVAPKWVTGTADLSAYAGKTVLVRFEYASDSGTNGRGFEFDNLRLGSSAVDGVEDASKWTFDGGFVQTDGDKVNAFFDNYYVIENRQWLGYDTGLKTLPAGVTSSWAVPFSYNPGVLVSYWNTQYENNQTGVHPGEGLILPIDMHQQVIKREDGSIAGTNTQVMDATLSDRPTIQQTLPNSATGKTYTVPSFPAVTTFDDRGSYWNPAIPDTGVKTPGYGVVVSLKNIDPQGTAKLNVAAGAAPPRATRGHGIHAG